MTIVICIRDPDSSNEYHVFGEPHPTIIDVDYGYLDLRDKDEYESWRSQLAEKISTLDESAEPGSPALDASKFLERLLAEADDIYRLKEE